MPFLPPRSVLCSTPSNPTCRLCVRRFQFIVTLTDQGVDPACDIPVEELEERGERLQGVWVSLSEQTGPHFDMVSSGKVCICVSVQCDML